MYQTGELTLAGFKKGSLIAAAIQRVHARAAELREILHDTPTSTTSSTSRRSPTPEYDKLFQELQAIEAAHPELATADRPPSASSAPSSKASRPSGTSCRCSPSARTTPPPAARRPSTPASAASSR